MLLKPSLQQVNTAARIHHCHTAFICYKRAAAAAAATTTFSQRYQSSEKV